MPLSWFRVYAELLNNRKFHRLSDTLKARLLYIWCLAAKNDGMLPGIEDIAFALRLQEAEAQETIEKLIDDHFLDRDDRGVMPHDWNQHQYVSDISTGRVQRFREKKATGVKRSNAHTGTASRNGSETAAETEVKRRVKRAVAVQEQTQTRADPEQIQTNPSAAETAAVADIAAQTFDPTDEQRAEAWPNGYGSGNGDGHGTSKKSLLNPELETELDKVAVRIHARHPAVRRCGLAEVKHLLRAIARKAKPAKRLEALREIDQNHASWCATPGWKKENGQYAKGLPNWLALTKERWAEGPPAVSDLPEDGGYRPAAEWDGL